jgi:hypothetical protein
MSAPQPEPPGADVRSFLPRPGEPVEDYAARLRALHHDLSLVLDAVERGLAAAEAEAEAEAEPQPPAALVAPLRAAHAPPAEPAEPHRSSPPPSPLAAPRGGARVEVVTAPTPAQHGERGANGPPEPQSAPWGGRRAPLGEGAPDGGEPVAPSPARSGEPWVERREPGPRTEPWHESPAAQAPWQQPPPWTDRRPSAWPPPPPPPAEMSFAPPNGARLAGPPRRRLPQLSPLAVSVALVGWLTALALALALLLGG